MPGINAKFDCQGSRELNVDFHSLHLRLTAGITRHWGATVRFGYMEHATTDDTSILAGPVYVF